MLPVKPICVYFGVSTYLYFRIEVCPIGYFALNLLDVYVGTHKRETDVPRGRYYLGV